MPIRTIQHPDVELFELDRSPIAPSIIGTTVLTMGFANKGMPYQITQPNSVSDLINTFGTPETTAEKYFHYAARQVIDNGGTCMAIKLPYNNTADSSITCLGIDFSASAEALSGAQFTSYLDYDKTIKGLVNGSESLSGQFTQIVTGSVDYGSISLIDYDAVVGEGVVTSTTQPSGITSAEFYVFNEARGKLNGAKEDNGIFVLFVDYIDSLVSRRLVDVGVSGYTDAGSLIQGVTVPSGSVTYTIDDTVDNFVTKLSASDINDTSLSRDLGFQFPEIGFINEYDSTGAVSGIRLDESFRTHIGVLVCRTYSDQSNDGKLGVQVLESFSGSLYQNAKNASNGTSDYVCDKVNGLSQYIKMYAAESNGFTDIATAPKNRIISINNNTKPQLLDFSSIDTAPLIDCGLLGSQIETALEKVSDIMEYQIDIVMDSGLSNIGSTADCSHAITYNPEVETEVTITSYDDQVKAWRNIAGILIKFCQFTRKDCMTIIDTPRRIELQGKQKRLRKTAHDKTFNNTIAPQLKFVSGLNSSYAAIYSNWRSVFDGFSGKSMWVPPSIHAGGVYVRTDRTAEIWDAPAGEKRGTLTGIGELAYQPKNADADQIYTKNINYAKLYPSGAFILEGQKTTQVSQSAFDRVNVRRLFLRLERFAFQTLKQFVYELNNEYTRDKVISALKPVFERYKAMGGLYDYRLVCDSSNNTPDVIDQNEMKISIFLKPVRVIEFIGVTFVATRSNGSFDEVV